MLVIISDIHLGDGTCSQSVASDAFGLFVARLKELAFNASWHADGTYHPLETVDILLLGDIMELQNTSQWLDKPRGEPGYVRPWTDNCAPEFAARVDAITRTILKHNAASLSILKALTLPEGLTLPPSNYQKMAKLKASDRVPVRVRIHYMLGNHDWYYHLPGLAFDTIRRCIVEAFGLHNSDRLFPHSLEESPELRDLLASYGVYARHGDIYDPLNFDRSHGRDSASLGDAFAVEVLNRFPEEISRQLGVELPPSLIDSLHELVNVRPALAAPLWIYGHLLVHGISPALQRKLKQVWNDLCDEFLALPFVRQYDKHFKPDILDGLELAIRLTDRVSFKAIDSLVVWISRKFRSPEPTFSRHALTEQAFLQRTAQFIVYGHTHHAEVVPLDTFKTGDRLTSQIYLNTGTWHTYFDLAICKPQEQKFVPYQVLTYLTFYKEGRRGGRRFESWSGAFSN